MRHSSSIVCIQCHNACRLIATTDGDRLLSVEPEGDLASRDVAYAVAKKCPRRAAAVEYVHHPGRLGYPLKRAGARGENRWQTISWEQGLAEVGERLDAVVSKLGPEAVACSSGTGRTHDELRLRFLNLLGTPNHVGPGSICYGPLCTVGSLTFGWRVFPVVRPNTQLAVAWGGGGPRYWDLFWEGAKKARRKGTCRILVVDPRRSDAADEADLWLQIRPGTDAALVLGIINYLIENRLYDRRFVEKWCFGFDQLVKRARDYPIGSVAEITGIPKEKIRQAAEWYGTLRPAATQHGMGVEHLENSIETLHAQYILSGITGNVDHPGGDVFPAPYPGMIHDQEIALPERLSEDQKRKTLGVDRFRLFARQGYDLIQENLDRVYAREAKARTSYEVYAHAPSVYRAMITHEPYPVRAMITLSSNPMVTQANTKLVYQALRSLDLYVVVDFFMTPSAQLADYVFPATTYLERPWLWTYSGVMGSERALPKTVPGRYDRRDDYDFWRGLGLELGQAGDWPWKTLEELYDYRLSPLGLTFEGFVAQGGVLSPERAPGSYERTGFATPSGKIELSSTILERLGYDPLPQFREPPESPLSRPDLLPEYSLILITGGRHQPYYHSEHRQIQSHRRRVRWPVVEVNPETAAHAGVSDGDWIWIETYRGRIHQVCRVTDRIMAGVIHVQHGWWFPEEDGAEPSLHGVFRSCSNVLTDDDPDVCNPISGGVPLRTALCKIYRCKNGLRPNGDLDEVGTDAPEGATSGSARWEPIDA